MKHNPLAELFRALWHYSTGNKKEVVLFYCLFVLNETVDLVVQPFLWANILNIVQENHGVTKESLPQLLQYLAYVLFLTVFCWGLHGPARILEQKNSFKVRTNYRKFLLEGVFALPMEWHVDHHSGDTIDKIEKGTNALFDFGGSSFVTIYSVTRLVVCLGMLAYYSHLAILVALVMMSVGVWITLYFDRILIPQYRELSRAENNISESVFDAISNISTVLILRVEKIIFSTIMKKVEKPFALFEKNIKINELKWALVSLCCQVMICLALAVFFWQQSRLESPSPIGVYYILISYLERVRDLVQKFCGLYGEVVKRRTRVMNAEELSLDFKTRNFGNHVLPHDWQNLEVRNLSFSYHGTEGDMHLEDVSLTIQRCKKIAFIGKSGSGKTTALKLMRDLYHLREVELLVDGKQIHEGFEGISRAITLVPQNPEIFATTIEENITLGAEYPLSLVMKYVSMACFTSTLQSLPHGLKSSIKEKGVNLSGGQQQRLALARGLLACHDKDIVLLDEPTSSLDTGTEMHVYQNIFNGFKGKTIISSIHRLHLLPLFDRIYRFDKGRIVGVGTLDELLSSSPEFQAQWNEYTQHGGNVCM